MKTKNVKLGVIAIALLSGVMPLKVKAQDKTEARVGADLVSSYIWRGSNCGGVSFQPNMTVAYKGLSLTAWGSIGIDKKDTKELDFTLGYSTGRMSLALTDYWFDYSKDVYSEAKNKYFQYDAHSTQHVFEGTLGYNFGPLAVSWNTNFAGADYRKENGKLAYSTYVEFKKPFKIGDLDFTAEVGLTPWKGAYADKFNVTNIGLGASKAIKITDSFSLPTFAKLTFNPYTEGAYFVFGINF